MGRSRGFSDRVCSSGAGRSLLPCDRDAPACAGACSAPGSTRAIVGRVVAARTGFSSEAGARSRQPITTTTIAAQLTAAHLPHAGHCRAPAGRHLALAGCGAASAGLASGDVVVGPVARDCRTATVRFAPERTLVAARLMPARTLGTARPIPARTIVEA